MPSALGENGDFPTYRCNDGSNVNWNKPCPELKDPVDGIVWPDREFVRSKARQTYAYGIAYHMTGDSTLLCHAKAGVDFLRQNALDRDNGGAYSYWEQGEPAPAVLQRRSQDLAYLLSGLGFYYYLTRDKAVLDDVLALKDYIFETYYDPSIDLLRWVIQTSPDKDQPNQKELVAQLDQIYGYMLWLTPVLPEPYRSQWQSELTHLVHIIIEQFYSPRINFFWG
jgi:hypothetical protein